MDLKLGEDKGFPKKEYFRLSRARNQKIIKCNLLEAIAQGHGGVVTRSDDDGVMRMKIVVRKQELKHMLAMMGSGKNGAHHQASSPSSSSSLDSVLSFEQRLHLMMRRRNVRRADHEKGSRRPWKPALQSIPEEL